MDKVVITQEDIGDGLKISNNKLAVDVVTSIIGSSETKPPSEKAVVKFFNQRSIELWNANGLVSTQPKVFTATVGSSDGKWSVDYSHVGFQQITGIVVSGATTNAGDGNGDGNFAAWSTVTTTGASGIINSATSGGLLAAMVMVKAKDGTQVSVTVYGF